MRPSFRSAISACTRHSPSQTCVGSSNSSPVSTRGTHVVAAVYLDSPRFLMCSAIQDSTTGRSLSAMSVVKMILTYTWLDFGWAAFFGVGSCAFTAQGTRVSVLTINANNCRVTTSPLCEAFCGRMVRVVLAARTNRVSPALPVIVSDDLNGYLLSGDCAATLPPTLC